MRRPGISICALVLGLAVQGAVSEEFFVYTNADLPPVPREWKTSGAAAPEPQPVVAIEPMLPETRAIPERRPLSDGRDLEIEIARAAVQAALTDLARADGVNRINRFGNSLNREESAAREQLRKARIRLERLLEERDNQQNGSSLRSGAG